MRRLSIIIGLALCFLPSGTAGAGPEYSDVFVGGAEGYHTYRIPAVAVSQNGAILAFAEGRSSAKDHAKNNIVLKRSTDSGRTWSALRTLAEDGENALNNPCVVVLRETGRILLMFQRYPRGFDEHKVVPGVEGERIVRTWLIHSDDDGLKWSAARDITAQTKRPTYVTSVATGPGNGIQLRHGPHAGRILMPFNQGPYGDWKVYAVISDDLGETWRYGTIAPEGSPGLGNEVQFVELSDGRVRLNARSMDGGYLRKTAVSDDGGSTWSPLIADPGLPEPQCQASIIRYRGPKDREGSILYCGPGTQRRRVNGTVRVSDDDGETWPTSRLLYEGHFAYSHLVALEEGSIGCLFETGARNPYEKIVFARFSLDWLREDADPKNR